MKNRFSRFLSLALAAMMLLAIAPVSALADEPVVLTMAAKNAPSAADYQIATSFRKLRNASASIWTSPLIPLTHGKPSFP